MSSQPAERMTSRYRPALAIGIVVLSIVLPAGLIGWSVASALQDKPILGRPSNVFKIYQGGVKHGELWFSESRLKGNPALSLFDSRIKRLDLQTGVEHDTGLVVPNDFAYSIWFGERLYVLTSARIYEVAGTSLVEIGRMLPRSATVNSSLFLHDDHLTTVRETDDGGICLAHLIDGQWKDGRPIVLPGQDRVWHDDQQRDRQVLLPLTSQRLTPTGRAVGLTLQVVQLDQQHHVMLTSDSGFAAYRTGFEFADEVSDGASALAPQNAPREVSGWEPIGPHTTANDRWMQMTGSHDGLLFVSWGSPQRIVRRTSDGHWKELTFSDAKYAQTNWVMSDPSQSTTYFVKENQTWSSAEVGRIEGDTVQPIHLVVPGCEVEYLGRWRRVLVAVLFAWLLHVAVLIGGAAWLTRGTARADFEFGIQRVTLAPLWRRTFATAIDAVLLLVMLCLLWQFYFLGLGLEWAPGGDRQLAESLLDVEQQLFSGRGGGGFPGVLFGSPIGWLVQALKSAPEFLQVVVVAMLALCGAKVYLEGRCGITPGKWLLGLRTVRTTLHPCGVGRAIVRNVLYCFDIPFLLTPLPAAMSLMFSDHRQRLGDRAADTLVIRAGSICDAKSS
ncbi:MAG: RDD family protein [Planctomycetota bacterium]